LAKIGWGLGTLVVQSVTMALCQTVITWWISPWRPLFCFCTKSFRELFSFGGYIFASNIIGTCYERCFTLVLGKNAGAYDLGIYSRAYSSQNMICGVISQMVNRVAFPLFSHCHDDKSKVTKTLRDTLEISMFLNVPTMIGLALLSEPFIILVYGDLWQGASKALVVLAVSGSYFSMQALNTIIISSSGNGKLFLKIDAFKKIIGIFIIVISSSYGMMGVAWGAMLLSIIALICNLLMTNHFIGLSPWRQILDVLPSYACSVVMVFSIVLFRYNVHIKNIFTELVTSVTLGVFVYFFTSFFIQSKCVKKYQSVFFRK
jgi:O-antigen/teichoic acid export membrane protein